MNIIVIKKTALASLLFSMLSSEAFSEDSSEIYPHLFIGANAGYQFESDIKTSDTLDKNSVYEFMAGSQFTENLSLDFGYEYHASNENDNNELSILQSNLRYDWYFIKDWSVYFKGGIAYWMEDGYQINGQNNRESGVSPMASLGVNYRLTPNLYLQSGYKFINNVGSSNIAKYDSNTLYLGATYHFKGDESQAKKVIEKPKFIVKKKETKLFNATLPSKISFDFDSYIFKNTDESDSIFEKVASILTKYPQAKCVITGHTDSIGSAEYNQKLSLKRAESVAKQLYRYGVSEEQLIVQGKGESRPVKPNNTKEGRGYNRRVELVVESFSYE